MSECKEKKFRGGGQGENHRRDACTMAPSSKPFPPTLYYFLGLGSQGRRPCLPKPHYAGREGGVGGGQGPQVPDPPPTKHSKPLAVVMLSGWLDSCVAAAVARRDFELALFHGNYGQRTVARELGAFRSIAAFWGVKRILEADLGFLGRLGGSSLTDTHLPVPVGEEEPPGIPPTYVPFRNSIFLAAAVAWAEVLGAQAVFIGANILDNPGYPDCRPEYFAAFNRLIELGTRPETRITIRTPLIHLDKAGIIRLGLDLGAPLELTWSCYQNDDAACGLCSSCRLRLKGFAEAGVTDPIEYQKI